MNYILCELIFCTLLIWNALRCVYKRTLIIYYMHNISYFAIFYISIYVLLVGMFSAKSKGGNMPKSVLSEPVPTFMQRKRSLVNISFSNPFFSKNFRIINIFIDGLNICVYTFFCENWIRIFLFKNEKSIFSFEFGRHYLKNVWLNCLHDLARQSIHY